MERAKWKTWHKWAVGVTGGLALGAWCGAGAAWVTADPGPAPTPVHTVTPVAASAVTVSSTPSPPAAAAPTTSEVQEAYYATCAAAKHAGAAPLHRGEPGYRSKLDRDGDGVACE